jgi:hypothetical protein
VSPLPIAPLDVLDAAAKAQIARALSPDTRAYIASLVAERDALVADAERYRWLRKRGPQQDFASALWEDDMDAAIDAARKALK